jgi:Flp pilus assembly protein TadG
MKPKVRDERGSAMVEAVLLTPVLVAMLLVVIFGGRVALTRQAVETAAADAARAASIARTASAARSDAAKSANTSLANQNIQCTQTQVTVDVGGFSKPVGTAATVSVTVVCDMLTSDLGLVGVPGTMRIEATMVSPLDTYRERT